MQWYLPKINPQKGTKTILLFRINLTIIQASGKHFFWKKPSFCPKCGGLRLWGHGFVLRYFFGFASGIWMKRWRCPDCKGVHTSRPARYSPGIQYPRDFQIKSILSKLAGKPFLKQFSRQIQQHWRKLFARQMRQKSNWPDPLKFLSDQLESGQFNLTKRTIYREMISFSISPYLTFALTTKRRPFSLE